VTLDTLGIQPATVTCAFVGGGDDMHSSFGNGEGGHTQTACEVSVECNKYKVQS
jgi:hypothetical protein